MNTYWTVIGISMMSVVLSAVSMATGQSTSPNDPGGQDETNAPADSKGM